MMRYAMLAVAALAAAAAPAFGVDEVEVPSVLIKLVEQVEVPAREAGVLDAVDVREGQMVATGDRLAQIEDGDARLDRRRAELELVAAHKQAESDVKVRYARKSLEVAESELRRAVESQKRLSQSVSDSEMDQLRLEVERQALSIEEAQLEVDLSRTMRELKENEVQLAEYSIRQRRVTAPLAGFVVEVNRHQGEWVQPGQTILRLLRLDRLRAEGLVSAESVDGDLVGRKVTLTVQQGGETQEFSGTLVFVNPEVDAVNGQVRVWAEIDNPKLALRPGLHGSMVIHGTSAPSAAR